MSDKISANSVKLGTILIIDESLWQVIKAPEHVKPGKGPAYVQLEMKNIKTGSKKNERISSSDYLDKAFLDRREMQYLYQEGDKLVLMDTESYEQMEVENSVIDKDKVLLLQDGMILEAEVFESSVINLELPKSVMVEVLETEPVIKGATAAPSYKQAIVSNGLRIKVPGYISIGEKISIKTEDLSFVERVSKN